MSRMTPVLVASLVVSFALVAGGVTAQTPGPEPAATAEPSPGPTGAIDPPDRVAGIMAGMSRRQKVGQLFMSRLYGFRARSPAHSRNSSFVVEPERNTTPSSTRTSGSVNLPVA